MRVMIGKVVDGKVVVEGDALEEGSTVTVLDRAGEQTFELDEDQEKELLEAIEEADRGEVIDARAFLLRLKTQR